MSKAVPFVINDETVYNSYGFRVSNAGIDLTRFKNNPVMLDGHWNSNESVLGLWEEINFNGATLTAVPVFDMEDEKAKKIAGKVERGFIKGCSMGLVFNPEHMVLEPNGKWLLSKSELLENSIIPVPSSANAIRLYTEKAGQFELMQEDEVKMCLSALSHNNNFENKKDTENMKKVLLSVAALVALGLEKITNPSEGVDANIVEDAINGLKSKLDNSELKLGAAEAALKKFQDAEAAKADAEVNAFLSAVIPAKYDESERESLTKLAKTDLAFAKKIADTMPAKTTLAGAVSNTAAATQNGEVKTMDDFQKLTDVQQLAFKNQNPEAYKKLVA